MNSLIVKSHRFKGPDSKLIGFLEQSYFSIFSLEVDIGLLDGLVDVGDHIWSVNVVAKCLVNFVLGVFQEIVELYVFRSQLLRVENRWLSDGCINSPEEVFVSFVFPLGLLEGGFGIIVQNNIITVKEEVQFQDPGGG